ncbi:PPOX class F420-dependent oxidoreductase [Streptomyces decoyicus]
MTRVTDGGWTPPEVHSGPALPQEVSEWLDKGACATLATLEPDGMPQLSVVWAHCDGRHVLMATVVGRRKHQNLLRNPKCTVLVTPPEDQDHYVEIRGRVEITEEGGRALIDRLHLKHRGTKPYPWDGPDDIRVVLQLHPERVITFCG